MRSFVCKVHGPQADPYVYWGKRRWPLRRCRICLKAIGKIWSKKPETKKRVAGWYRANRTRVCARNVTLNRERKLAIIKGYGGSCTCCGEMAIEFLTIDHIHGGGRRERETTLRGLKFYRWLIANNFPRDRYRLLCMNCNFSHGKYGYCPHQRMRLKAV